jgi:uncharacterized oligopeptide transporter (OPT) family protein
LQIKRGHGPPSTHDLFMRYGKDKYLSKKKCNSQEPILGFCNAYGSDLTDWSLSSAYRKLAIFTIGAWAWDGGVLADLAACGVLMNIVSTASDLMQDFTTGYMTLASPRFMFISQVIFVTQAELLLH